MTDLDRWLAENVMGWVWDDVNGWVHPGGWSPLSYEDGSFHAKQIPWHPTSDLTQAFMCVEKMREKGWFLELKYLGGPPDGWRAMWSRFSLEKPNFVYAFDDNPALAICKAIKAALSNEKEESR